MDEYTIKLPAHAIRFLKRMCKEERSRINYQLHKEQYSIQADAAYDSLDTIVESLPDID